MKVTKTVEATKLTVKISGRLDTTTVPLLETEMQDALDGITELVLDFSELDYISSAGLRILLTLHKRMTKQGSMVVTNVNDIVSEVFEVTGFCDILNIE